MVEFSAVESSMDQTITLSTEAPPAHNEIERERMPDQSSGRIEKDKGEKKAMLSKLDKLREDRMAKQQARLNKLRTLNIQKYSSFETPKAAEKSKSMLKVHTSLTDVSKKPASKMNTTVHNDTSGRMKPFLKPPVFNSSNVVSKATVESERKVNARYSFVPPRSVQKSMNLTAGPVANGHKFGMPANLSVNGQHLKINKEKNIDLKIPFSNSKTPATSRASVRKSMLPEKTTSSPNKNKTPSEKSGRKSLISETKMILAQGKSLLEKKIEKSEVAECKSAIPEKPTLSQVKTKSCLRKSILPVAKDVESKKSDVPKRTAAQSRKSLLPERPASAVTKRDTRMSMVPERRAASADVTKRSIPLQNGNATKLSNNADVKKTSKIPSGKSNSSRVSVFDRLYNPKYYTEKSTDRKKTIYEHKEMLAESLGKKRMTLATDKILEQMPNFRRSISAVHFKRVHQNELKNCIHKCASISDGINKLGLKENEDHSVKQDVVTSAVKSERKSNKTVKFQNQSFTSINTPKPEELQQKLKDWLQKRGKSLSSYHHLQCFGIHHMTQTQKELNFDYDRDEDKENIEVEIPDDDSFDELVNAKSETPQVDKMPEINNGINDATYVKEHETPINLKASGAAKNDNAMAGSGANKHIPETAKNSSRNFDKWRRASYRSEVTDMNSSTGTDLTVNSDDIAGPVHRVEELMVGALADLGQLIREDFSWEQCARWLRAIRERFPRAPNTHQYWECRAALEERQGNLTSSCQCWEEAIAKGTETSVAEASLDQLLDKFMQLNIDPGTARSPPAQSAARRRQSAVDPKLLDVKNVFKSTLIRFAVQKAKIHSSETARFTATPVRRSARLSPTMQGPGRASQGPGRAPQGPGRTPQGPGRTPQQPPRRAPLVLLCGSLADLDDAVRTQLTFVPNKSLHLSP